MELLKFNRNVRHSLLQDVSSWQFDLLVIGGGITGASILRDAAQRGLRAVLVEARDFAIGTSSRSSKLVHGGLRYLKTGTPWVTWESCHERDLHIRLNRRLVEPEPFLVPVYKDRGPSRALLKAGMVGYEIMSGLRNTRRHRFVSRDDVMLRAPGIRFEGLIGGYEYYDAIVNDFRFTLETVKDAVRAGGIALNYCPAVSIQKENGICVGAAIEDSLTGTRREIRAKCIVNATGVSADEIRLMDNPDSHRLIHRSRGTHIVLRAQDVPSITTMALSSPIDGRMVFLIRHGDYFLFGTTDDWENTKGTDPVPGAKDTGYLLNTLRQLMPETQFDESKIQYIYSGFRPLIGDDSATSPPNRVSRQYHTEVSVSGLISIMGGKLTTARHMAEKIVDLVCRKIKRPMRQSQCKTGSTPIGSSNEEVARTIQFWSSCYPQLKEKVIRIANNYGNDATAIIQQAIRQQPPWQNDFSNSLEAAEIEYLCKYEMVCRVSDLVERRIPEHQWDMKKKTQLLEKHKNVILDALNINEIEFNCQTASVKLAA